ncbi:MAG: cysteine desulfurase family protein [Eubacteriales bacterium]|nr:cysteine desulfurase family protein [Eubacteriales bacterium]
MIYFDYNATTPIDAEVAKAMLPYIREHFGNPSSGHDYGRIAKVAVEKARAQVAGILNVGADEIIFTSGGSESNNTAIKGVAWHNRSKGNHIITSVIEHPAVLNVCEWLKTQGFEISYLPVDSAGRVNPADLEAAITQQTILVSIMHANNETGTIQPIRELADIAHRNGALFHTDAAQSVGKIPTDVQQMGVDLLTIAGHKLYAPKGIGALYIRRGIQIDSLIHGASHERGLRAGTENVVFDVALGKACEIARFQLANPIVRELTDYFWSELEINLGDLVHLNGHPTERLPNTLNISFMGKAGYEILDLLPDVAASTGSACHTGETALSPVLRAMGVSIEAGRGAVRFSLGRYTQKTEINLVVNQIVAALNKKGA